MSDAIVVTLDGDAHRTTWREFVADNECMDPDELDEILLALLFGQRYVGGGGAAPVFTVEIAR